MHAKYQHVLNNHLSLNQHFELKVIHHINLHNTFEYGLSKMQKHKIAQFMFSLQ